MQPQPPPSPPLPPADPYRYGWRYVKKTLPSGEEEVDPVPLTVEVVLPPEEGAFIGQSTLQKGDWTYLAKVFSPRPLSPPFALVPAALRVDWGVPGLRPHGPDVAVFVGLERAPRLCD